MEAVTVFELGEGLLTFWFLAFLALVWIAVILPAGVRASRTTPLPASRRFKQAMRTIAPAKSSARRSTGRWLVVPPVSQARDRGGEMRARHRRRRVLLLLLGLAGATAAAAVTSGGRWLEVQLIADGLLVFYVGFLLEAKRRSAERKVKVTPLHRTEPNVVVLDEPVRDRAHA